MWVVEGPRSWDASALSVSTTRGSEIPRDVKWHPSSALGHMKDWLRRWAYPGAESENDEQRQSFSGLNQNKAPSAFGAGLSQKTQNRKRHKLFRKLAEPGLPAQPSRLSLDPDPQRTVSGTARNRTSSSFLCICSAPCAHIKGDNETQAQSRAHEAGQQQKRTPENPAPAEATRARTMGGKRR